MKKDMKSSKLLEENTQAKPHLLPTTGQLGKEEKWNGPGDENGRLSLGSGRKFL